MFSQVNLGVSLHFWLWTTCDNKPQLPQRNELSQDMRGLSPFCPDDIPRAFNKADPHRSLYELTGALLLHCVCELLYLVVHLSLFTHQLLNLGRGMHDCGVVSPAKAVTDLREREIRQLS